MSLRSKKTLANIFSFNLVRFSLVVSTISLLSFSVVKAQEEWIETFDSVPYISCLENSYCHYWFQGDMGEWTYLLNRGGGIVIGEINKSFYARASSTGYDYGGCSIAHELYYTVPIIPNTYIQADAWGYPFIHIALPDGGDFTNGASVLMVIEDSTRKRVYLDFAPSQLNNGINLYEEANLAFGREDKFYLKAIAFSAEAAVKSYAVYIPPEGAVSLAEIKIDNVRIFRKGAPVASFTYTPAPSQNISVGQEITFDASSSYDPNGTIMEYNWGFGDGSIEKGNKVKHIYSEDGEYVVTLTVVDNDGLTDSTEDFVSVTSISEPVLEILDGADFSVGPEVSDDPNKIATGGTAVEGAVTDGVTRLLLRLPLSQLNEVTFSLEGGTGKAEEDGILRSIERNLDNTPVREGNSITVTSSNVGDKEYAFAIYRAPENFVRKSVDNNYDGKPDDETVPERSITVRVKSTRDPIFEFTQEIKLIRPPLILVHGLWSSPGETWDKPKTNEDFKGTLEKEIPGIKVFTIDYSKRNASHFESNKNVPYSCKGTNIQTIREQYKKSYKIALIQVDILGHSMGGLLARIWAGAGDYIYLRNNNFWAGDINKLITLDSPHYGSFLADAAINCYEGLHSLDATAMFLLFEKSGHSITRGAVEDLMTTSEPIKQMNRVTIIPPSHTIAGQYVDVYPGYDAEDRPIIYGIPDSYFGIHNMLINEGYGDTIMHLVTQHQTDLVVSTQSQQGGLNISSSSIFGHHHTAATTSDTVTKTVSLLNSDTKNNFNLGFPKGDQ